MRIALLLAVSLCVEPMLFALDREPQTAFARSSKHKKKNKKKKATEEVQQPLFPIQRETPLDLTATVVIPCNAKQFPQLRSLLQAYEEQTVLPDEVIIPLAQFETLPILEVLALERFPWSFPVMIIKLGGKKTVGWLRNCGVSQAKGDIILCQEPTALPHPQRVEIVAALFENYYVDCLLHEGVVGEMPLPKYEDPAGLALHRHGSYQAVQQQGIAVNAGNICIAKQVAQDTKWSEEENIDQDARFNEKIYQQFKNNLTVEAKLLLSKGP